MLNSLPVELFRSTLEDFLSLDALQLSRLDVAFCNRSRRSDLLALLPRMKTDINPTLYKANSLASYLQWGTARMLPVTRLTVDLKVFTEPLPVFTAVPSIMQVDIIEPMQVHQSIPVTSINDFLMHFPSLQTLGGWQNLTNEQFLAFAEFPLQGLNLLKCARLTAQVVSEFVFSKLEMRMLHCHVLDVQALETIATKCSGFTTLNLCTKHLTTTLELEQLCIANALSLTHLTLEGGTTDEVLTRIVTRCPLLEHLSCVGDDMESSQVGVLKAIVSSCPRICTVNLSAITVKIVNNTAAAVVQKFLPSLDDQKILVSILPPVRSYQLEGIDERVTIEAFQYTALTIGVQLESLDLYLPNTFEESCIAEFLQCCLNLKAFTCQPTSNAMLRGLFAALPSACQLLRKVTITGGMFFMSWGIVFPEFEGFQGLSNTVEELYIPQGMPLCGASLRAIADAFTSLRTLHVLDDRSDKEVLLDIILSDKLKAKRLVLGMRTASWLDGQLQQHGMRHSKVFGRTEIWLPLD